MEYKIISKNLVAKTFRAGCPLEEKVLVFNPILVAHEYTGPSRLSSLPMPKGFAKNIKPDSIIEVTVSVIGG